MRTIITTTILTLVLASSAFANSFPLNVDTLQTYLNGQGGFTAASYVEYTGGLTGNYDFTAIAFEAADNNLFVDGSGTTLFNNADTSNWGTWAQAVDASTAHYASVTQGDSFTLDMSNVAIYQLTNTWTVPTLNIELAAGTLVFGFNDTGSGDGDFDDLIMAARPTASTPIPGAVWLLGSGLIGLVGIRRNRRI